MILSVLALAAVAPPPAVPSLTADPAVTRLAALYEEVCLTAFPYDAQVDALMAAKGAKPLTADEVKVTLRNDPGRGWLLEDADGTPVQVTLELPPYHACSVRRMTAGGLGDPVAYRAVAQRFKRVRPGFAPEAPMNEVIGDLRIQATVERRALSGGAAEALMVFEQRVADAGRVAAGETRVNLRFVHQIVAR